MKKNCARAEILAGALALGEATDAERNEFRSHIAVCSSCLNAIGGEREIERTMEIVSEARASEVWEPVLTAASTIDIQKSAPASRVTRGSSVWRRQRWRCCGSARARSLFRLPELSRPSTVAARRAPTGYDDER